MPYEQKYFGFLTVSLEDFFYFCLTLVGNVKKGIELISNDGFLSFIGTHPSLPVG